MSSRRPIKRLWHSERGVTMILVVIAMFSMLAMVALAIDVITLFSARSEAQRAADSAALAAAKMLVDAGVTGDPTLVNPTVQTLAQSLATEVAKDTAAQATIGGSGIAPANVTVTFPNGGNTASFAINPTVNVAVKATLPAFFSRIWNGSGLSVSATAKAEGFNPSNSSTLAGGTGVPIVAHCVKPFLLPNCDPVNPNNLGSNCGAGYATFFNVSTGAITNPGQSPAGVIGETFHLVSNCGAGPGCATPGPPSITPSGPGGTILYYYPVQIGSSSLPNACPSSCGVGVTTLESDIECCNRNPLTCGPATATVPNTLNLDTVDFPEGGGGPAQSGVECLIHQRPGTGQDILNANLLPGALSYPLEIQVGQNHPLSGTPSLAINDYISTSDSLVTVPVYNNGAAAPTSPVTIIGFLQLFIVQTFPGGGGPKAGEIQVTVVNVAGCGSSATGTPIYSAASSPLAVRLVQ